MQTLEDLPPKIRDILRQLREGLAEMYGERLRGLVLFGSWARGDAEEDSDIDVAVVLDTCDDPYDELHHIMDVAWPLSLENTVVVSIVPMSEKEWRHEQSSFLMNVRHDGVAA
jgi:predicted nucleotidyltransferase